MNSLARLGAEYYKAYILTLNDDGRKIGLYLLKPVC
jgi:hypothetical protein